jgi:hypothetical protein
MLSVNAYQNATGIVIASDQSDNVYFQQVATSPQSILYANNSSFMNNGPGTYGVISLPSPISSTEQPEPAPVSPTIYVTNGSELNVSAIRHDNWPLRSPGSQYGDSGSFITTFPLSSGSIDEENEPGLISGSVTYLGTTWSFSGSGGALTMQGAASNSPYVSPTNVFYVDGGGLAFVAIRWTNRPLPSQSSAVLAASDVPSLTITYDANPRGPEDIIDQKTGKVIGTDPNISLVRDVNRTVSAGPTATFTLPVTSAVPGRIIAGTLTGTLLIGRERVKFETGGSGYGNVENTLTFNGAPSTSFRTIDGGEQTVRGGVVNLSSGVVTFNFTSDIPGGVTLESARYAVYNKDPNPNKVILSPGLDVSAQLSVDLLTSGSEVSINSPLISTPSLDLRASSVSFNAVTKCDGALIIGPSLVDHAAFTSTAVADATVNRSNEVQSIFVRAGEAGQGYDDNSPPSIRVIGGNPTRTARARATVRNGVVVAITVEDRGAGYSSLPTIEIDSPQSASAVPPIPTAEQVLFNAPISSNIFDIRVADDPQTTHRPRSSVVVSPSGSLSAEISSTTSGATKSASSMFMQVRDGDIYIEGAVNCVSQTYLMQSDASMSAANAPYVFTTRASDTGAATGLLTGKSVGITLGNDVATPLDGGALENIVDIDTSVESLRVTAATANGKVYSGAFPYKLDVRAVSDIAIDAVASSGATISLRSEANMRFNAALSTSAGVSIEAKGAFVVSAPISSVRGPIGIVGSTLTLFNSVRVLDAVEGWGVDDITLTSTAGDLSLTGAVTAVNDVRLVQRNAPGAAGRISGPSRVSARGLWVEAEGAVSLRTDVNQLSGRSGGDFAINERNDINITSLRAPGMVSLFAGGIDPSSAAVSPNDIALRAQLEDVVALEASAPKGSIDIVTNSSRLVTLGNDSVISAGNTPGMTAAGSVSIVSTVGALTVADAPVGGSSATRVRLATQQSLEGTYAQNSPGLFASTITGARGNPLKVDGIAVRLGDRLLVRNQSDAKENGVYVVASVGTAASGWVLARARELDTTVEIPEGTFVSVEEGASAGLLYTVAYVSLTNRTPISVAGVSNRAGAERVRAATTTPLLGVYSEISSTIEAKASGALSSIDGVTLALGDRVLVKDGTDVGGRAANGIYEVSELGSTVTKWRLSRVTDSLTNLPLAVCYAAASEGTSSAALTGRAFALRYDSLGVDEMQLIPVTSSVTTAVGAMNVNSVTSFVVSSTAGTNESAGSLGKMIRLRQSSSLADSPRARTDFLFATVLPGLSGAPAGVIRLQQELPVITKPFAIDGTLRYSTGGGARGGSGITVDGSRVVTTKDGSAASSVAQVNGFNFGPGSGASGTKPGGSLSGLTIGGFSRGAAVRINGAPGILVNSVVLGRNEAGDRLANRFGVLAANNTAGSSIVGSTIVGSTTAGVRVAATSNGVTIVGSTIGVDGQNNATGVRILNGNSRIGVDPVGGVVRAITTSGSDQFALPSSVPPAAVFVGQPITGTGIPTGTFVSAVNGSTLSLSKKMTATGSSNVTFGQPRRNAVQYNLNGIVLNGGANTTTNTDVSNNTFDGIKIGGGTQSVGTSSVLGSNSNAVFGNGDWGVNILTPAVPSQQVIKGTYFGGRVKATVGNANTLGNIAVDGTLAPAGLGYNPVILANAVFASDAWGNRYVRPSGNLGNTNINQPWRP